MKITKIIYFCIVPALLVLVMTAGFLHAFSGGPGNKASAAFIENTKTYALKIDAEAKKAAVSASNVKTQDTSKYVRDELATIFKSSPLSIRASSASTESIKDKEGEELYRRQNIRYNRQTVTLGDGVTTETYVVANYFVNTSTTFAHSPRFETQAKMGLWTDDSMNVAVERVVNNLLVIIPGNNTKQGKASDAILFTAHMDAPTNMTGRLGGADTAALGAMVNQIVELKTFEDSDKSRAKYDNDLVFLFTDARFDNNYGIYTFMEQFNGYYEVYQKQTDNSYKAIAVPDLVSRIKLAVNFDSIGNGSTSMLLQTSEDNSKLVSEYAKIMGGSVSNSFISDIYSSYPSDYRALNGLNSLNLVTFGNLKNQNTSYDTLDTIDNSVYAKKAGMVSSLVQHFGSYNLNDLKSDNGVNYFSFLGLFTIRYSNMVSYILGAIVLLLFAVILIVNIFKKAFKFDSLAKGIGVQLLAITATLATMFVFYFLIGLLLAGFGLFTIQSLASFVFASPGTIIGYMLFAAAMLGLYYQIFQKMFGLRAANTVRGGAALWGLIGAIMCFAYPALGTIFAIPAILVMATMLITTFFKNSFKEKFGFHIEQMMFFLLPMIIALPIMLPVICVLAVSLRALLIPIILLPFMMALSIVAPYAGRIKPVLDRLLFKLPKRTIRVRTTVTEKVYDKAKPGKYTEVTSEKIIKEKKSWQYRNGVGMTIVAVIAAIVIMACSAVGVPFGGSVYANATAFDYTQTIYDSSMVLTWSKIGTSSERSYLEIHDKSVYKYVSGVLSDFSWNGDKNAYVKPVTFGSEYDRPSADYDSGDRITVRPAFYPGLDRGIVELTIHDAASIKMVSVLNPKLVNDNKIIEVTNKGRESITLRFPMSNDELNADFDEILLEFDFGSNARPSRIDLTVKQFIWDYNTGSAMAKFTEKSKEYANITQHLKNYSQTIQNSMKYGVVYELRQDVRLAQA